MKLTIEQIKDVTTGASKIVYEDGVYHFFRFNDREFEVIDNTNALSTAGIQMKFKTDGRLLKLKVHTEKATELRSFFCFDIFVNNILEGCIQNLSDDACKEDYACREYSLGCYEGEFNLGDGEKYVKIVFPHSAVACVEEIEIVDATHIVPIKREKTIIFYGDSITQGYDAHHPSNTYAARLADAIDAEAINKALGGEKFDPELIKNTNTNPDYVVVAYGTNDWNAVDLDTLRKNAKGFLYALQKVYPDVPKYIITPIWRTDWKKIKRCGEFSILEETIKEVFENQENIIVISGIDLMPHDEKLFGDLFLHPSDDGFEYYYRNLLKYFIR